MVTSPTISRRSRLALVLGGAVAGGLTLLAWTQDWFAVALDGGQTLSVAGQVAAPALSALALAALALSGALAIAGRILRVALGVIEAAIGIVIIVSSLTALTDPIAASAQAVTDATAVAGAQSIAALVTSTTTGIWPVVAIAAGSICALIGVFVAITSPRWPGATKKYETTPTDESDTTVGAWDTLSGGGDPT